MKNGPIGIFDSGVGGLTVFREIVKSLPNESLVYLGDTARVPYGNKSAQTVTSYSIENVRFLIERGVKAVVVACNSASALAMSELERNFEIPIVGVLEPGADEAIEKTKGHIGIIGTRGTITSKAYEHALHARRRGIRITSKPCPLFVPLVEEGWLGEDETYSIAERYLGPLVDAGVDTLILGCTHYPLLRPVIQETMGKNVRLVDSAHAVAHTLKERLSEKGLLCDSEREEGARDFWVTDSPERFGEISGIFLEKGVKNVRKV